MDEIVREFLVECAERLDQLDRDLVELEQRPAAPDLVASAFRALHTIKGTSSMLAFSRLEALTHAGEGLLARVREGRAEMTPAMADTLLQVSDLARDALEAVKVHGCDTGVQVHPVIDQVTALLRQPPGPAYAVPASDHLPGGRDLSATTVRVEVTVLDTLTGLVAELAATRDQVVAESLLPDASPDLVRAAQRLDTVTDRLEYGVLTTTQQPIGQLWSRLPRIVRDLGAQCGKDVSLTILGYETEIDRRVQDALWAPLTHLLRNAVDHGIETPRQRSASGKHASGTVTLRAAHEVGRVVVEVSDDGAGIDAEQVAARALAQGVCSATELLTMSHAEVLQLIMLPGFSTTTCATRLSGRGVGMDVVRADVEAIGGTVEIESSPGSGTTCRLRIPLAP